MPFPRGVPRDALFVFSSFATARFLPSPLFLSDDIFPRFFFAKRSWSFPPIDSVPVLHPDFPFSFLFPFGFRNLRLSAVIETFFYAFWASLTPLYLVEFPLSLTLGSLL